MVQVEPVNLVHLGDRGAVAAPERGGGHYRHAVGAALADRRSTLMAALATMQRPEQAETIGLVAELLVDCLQGGGKVLVVGNGGSAAEAQHLATELVGRFKRERRGYPVLALTADTAVLTAVGNDYGYPEVFARQVEALGQPGDVLIAFSTSGESENVINAALAAARCEMPIVGITADRSSRLERLADLTVRVPVTDTPLAQELHVLVLHILCDIVEGELCVQPPRDRHGNGNGR